jgi:hypothetical protein
MGLSTTDAQPIGISLTSAYESVRSWYRNHRNELENRDDEYGKASAALISALPSADAISEIEIRAIFSEVISGRLEWAYHRDDGSYKMAAYAKAALDAAGHGERWLEKGETELLKESRLWPYLTHSNYSVR